MSADIIKNIDVDVYDRKLIYINAKQGDKLSRYILVTCYNQGELIQINSETHSAYVRMQKPDGRHIFNKCEITNNGQIKIELTEQMLLINGNAYADLMIVTVPETDIYETTNTGDLSLTDGTVLTTMLFCINIVESACNCWDIESTDEFNALNSLILQAQKNYFDVMNACKSSENNIKALAVSMGGVFSPMGTITFAELQSVPKAVGYVYHISDSFITDETFKSGTGTYLQAGTNVYRTADGYWDYMVGETLEVSDDGNGNVSLILKL